MNDKEKLEKINEIAKLAWDYLCKNPIVDLVTPINRIISLSKPGNSEPDGLEQHCPSFFFYNGSWRCGPMKEGNRYIVKDLSAELSEAISICVSCMKSGEE